MKSGDSRQSKPDALSRGQVQARKALTVLAVGIEPLLMLAAAVAALQMYKSPLEPESNSPTFSKMV